MAPVVPMVTNVSGLFLGVITDSYKLGHPDLFPVNMCKGVAHASCRAGFPLADGSHDRVDTRVVAYGVNDIVDRYLTRQWTHADVDQLSALYDQHNVGNTPYPYPKDLFHAFIDDENNGFFPVKIEALPDGTVVNARVPIYQITAEGKYAKLATFLESLLTMSWYQTTVATLSSRIYDVLKRFYDLTVDEVEIDGKMVTNPFIGYGLHDFGLRACTGVEQAELGGEAHQTRFCGSDNIPAIRRVMNKNGGVVIAVSVPATEHSVMTAFQDEIDAVLHAIEMFGHGVISIVADSYDLDYFLEVILPAVYARMLAKGGKLVVRPDSGDRVQSIMKCMHALAATFGYTVNKKGFKVLKGCGVLQGDGIDIYDMDTILEAMRAAKFSAVNIVFGMGGGLLHRINRDSLSHATKLAYAETVDADGNVTAFPTMKDPKTDPLKVSMPGVLAVCTNDAGTPMVYPAHRAPAGKENLLKVIYDHGKPVTVQKRLFSQVRTDVATNWASVPPGANPISSEMEEEILACRLARLARLAKRARIN